MTIKRLCSVLLLIACLTSCSTKPDNEKTTASIDTLKSINGKTSATSTDTFKKFTHNPDTPNDPKKKVMLFDNQKLFEVISFKRNTTKQSSASDTNMCKGWSLNKEAVYKAIKDCQNISGTEWDLTFDVLPCIVEGQLLQAGQSYKFEINGGSWMSVTCSDTTLILGNYKKNDRKYFLSKPYEE